LVALLLVLPLLAAPGTTWCPGVLACPDCQPSTAVRGIKGLVSNL
jgi:hypothetical protein